MRVVGGKDFRDPSARRPLGHLASAVCTSADDGAVMLWTMWYPGKRSAQIAHATTHQLSSVGDASTAAARNPETEPNSYGTLRVSTRRR
jgi:hypothetical protein